MPPASARSRRRTPSSPALHEPDRLRTPAWRSAFAASGDKWLVPFGARLGKLQRLWKLPINLDAAAFWNATHPENLSCARWAFRPRAALIL